MRTNRDEELFGAETLGSDAMSVFRALLRPVQSRTPEQAAKEASARIIKAVEEGRSAGKPK